LLSNAARTRPRPGQCEWRRDRAWSPAC
jgi:hypothetical protein